MEVEPRIQDLDVRSLNESWTTKLFDILRGLHFHLLQELNSRSPTTWARQVVSAVGKYSETWCLVMRRSSPSASLQKIINFPDFLGTPQNHKSVR